jgi:FkbM family methyltransferase
MLSKARKLARWYFPKNQLSGILAYRTYHALYRTQALRPGFIQFRNAPLHYSDNIGLMHSLKEIFADEIYKFIPSSEKPIIIDAGSNIGLSVIYFKTISPESSIIAFEPDALMFTLLSRNVRERSLAHVELHETAAWTENTHLEFFSDGSLAGSSELNSRGPAKASFVRAERLKDVLSRFPEIDFLKVDIEGAENFVVEDIAEELPRVKNFFLEYHSSPSKPQKLDKILAVIGRAGFRYSIQPVFVPENPFVIPIDTEFDLQLNIFCYRR